MKQLLLLAAIVLASCSKSKDELPTNGIKITVQAFVIQKYWYVTLSSPSPITSKGMASVQWDVISNGQGLYTKEATFAYEFDGSSNASISANTMVQGAVSMSATNGKIKNMSGSGGYVFINR